MAVLCCESNRFHHPHPAHAFDLDAPWLHRLIDADYETVHELTFDRDGYRYGWVPFEGKRGQKAFCVLARKCVGYA
jgi:hypothetical protein